MGLSIPFLWLLSTALSGPGVGCDGSASFVRFRVPPPPMRAPLRLAMLVLVLLACGVTACRRASPAISEGRPNVLLVTIDTLRADHVGCYGRASAATPTLDSLAARGV